MELGEPGSGTRRKGAEEQPVMLDARGGKRRGKVAEMLRFP